MPTLNPLRPIIAGQRTYTGKLITPDIAEKHARLSTLAAQARDRVTRARYLDLRHKLLQSI